MTSGPARILVAGPSPAMDRMEILERFELDRVNRSTEVRARPGGKSLIIGRTLRRLGAEVTLHGFLGGPVGDFIRKGCDELGIEDRHTQIAGATRITPVIVETATGRATVLNEPSPPVTSEEADSFTRSLIADAGEGDLVVLTGSLPESLPVDFYGTLVDALTERGARVVLDTSGPALREAVRHSPWMVKPNREEFGAVIGVEDPDDDAVLEGMHDLLADGVGVVVVTLGAEGVLVAGHEETFRLRVPVVSEVVNATGSGDMMLAGIVLGCAREDSLRDAVRLGAALSVANAATLEPVLADDADLDGLVAQMVIEALERPRRAA